MRIHNGLRRWIVNTVSPRARGARMRRLVEQMRIVPGMRIVDLGGIPSFWRFCPVPLDITIVNLDVDQIKRRDYEGHHFTIVAADATRLSDYPDNAFDLVFSNSTIEHVGDKEKRAAFAGEIRRLAPSYYVQSPSLAFPYEVHTGLPFWWFYPRRLREAIINNWRQSNPVLAEFVAGTTIVRMRELRALFPDARTESEWMLGLRKSNIAFRPPV